MTPPWNELSASPTCEIKAAPFDSVQLYESTNRIALPRTVQREEPWHAK